MPSRPTVVLDISPLGYAFQSGEAARGIHRVVKHLFEGLLAADACDLRFVSTSHLASTWDFLHQQHPAMAHALFFRRGQLALSRSARRIERWVERTLSNRWLPLRAARWLGHRWAVWADERSVRISPRALAGAHIYHSTLAPLPREVTTHDDLRAFLTIYDVIPLSNPESVDGRGVPLLRKTLNSADERSYAFCISQTVKDELLQFSQFQEERVFVTALAAEREVFHPVTDGAKIEAARSKYGIPAAPYFLTLSSYDPRKNFGHIIECFGRLAEAEELAGCNLVIVGSNPERNQFVDAALKTFPRLSGRIIRPGFIPDHDLAAIYSGALAFVFPSLSEGFGIPPLEAMQCGVPVISSNAPALPEVLGDAAILLDPKDIAGWCAALRDVAANPATRADLAARSLARAALFRWDRFIDATLEGYRRAASPDGESRSRAV